MGRVSTVTVCKIETCRAVVDPDKLVEHVLSHDPNLFFAVVPVLGGWKPQAEEKTHRKG